MSFNLGSNHKMKDRFCTEGECQYAKGHIFWPLSICNVNGCKGIMHVIKTNWDNYSFGHGGGHVGFTFECSLCQRTEEY